MIFSLLSQPILPAVSLGCASRVNKVQPASMIWHHFTRGTGKNIRSSFSSYPFSLIHRPLFVGRSQQNEEEAAVAAAGLANTGASTIFDKIIKKEIPATIVYEDDQVLAFRDINPQAPVHIILIPKIRDQLTQLSKAEPRHRDVLGHLMYTTGVIAKQEGIEDGYRVVVNNGPTACQSVYYLHLHIIGGRQLKWPPG